jgi:hypothetical protein
MWCEMAEANNFKFAQHLKIPKTYSKQLAMWKKFSNYRINEDINYKIDFYRDFTNNTYKSAIYTLQFFPSIEKECVPIIEEYVNFNFGEIDVQRKNNIDTAKIEELKKIIEKHDK